MNTQSTIRPTTLLALFAAALLAACGPEASDKWDEPLSVSGPLESEAGLVYVNETLAQINLVQPRDDGETLRLDLRRAEIGESPGARALTADGQGLYLVDEDSETLQVLELGGDEIERKDIGLDSAYNRLSVDPEGEFLLMSFSGAGGNFVARNVNELGIVDLRDGLTDGEEADFVTLSSRPEEIVFAPAFELGGQQQRLAASLSPSEVTVIDLLAESPENQLREVPLTISQADQVRRPTQAIFDVTPSEEAPNTVSLYLLTDTGSDVTQIAIQPSINDDAPRKFDLSVNQLAAGRDPGQMALLELPQGDRLLTIDQRRPEFSVVDIESGESSTFDLPMTRAATQLLTYRTAVDGEPETRVLAYSPESPLVAVIRPESIAVGSDTPTVGRSVVAVRLKAAPSRVEMDPTADTERAIAYHGGLSSGFTVLNLRTNRAVPIQGSTLGDVTFSGPFAYGVFRGTAHFGIFDLTTGHPTDFLLPMVGEQIFVLEDQELILVEHNRTEGAFTLFRGGGEPSMEEARVFENVFLRDLLQQELP
jgi:hypothetical protein